MCCVLTPRSSIITLSVSSTRKTEFNHRSSIILLICSLIFSSSLPRASALEHSDSIQWTVSDVETLCFFSIFQFEDDSFEHFTSTRVKIALVFTNRRDLTAHGAYTARIPTPTILPLNHLFLQSGLPRELQKPQRIPTSPSTCLSTGSNSKPSQRPAARWFMWPSQTESQLPCSLSNSTCTLRLINSQELEVPHASPTSPLSVSSRASPRRLGLCGRVRCPWCWNAMDKL